jgi:dihydroflavonol-4-reductase
MAARVLVTGGTGFTGAHLVRTLVARGDEVRVLARSRERAAETLPPEAEVVVGDVADRAAVDRAMAGVDVVFHLAAAFRTAGIPDSRYREIHVDGTRYLLEAARGEGVRRFVHCSTIGVHGHIDRPPADETTPHRPGDIYQVTKSEGEGLALRFQQEHDFPLTVARPASIYGPGDLRLLKLFRMIAKGRFVMFGSGEVGFHTVYVEDLVRGFLLMAEDDAAIGEVFILAGERSVSLNELVRVIARALDVPTPRLRLPVAPVMAAAHVIKALCVPLRIEPPLYPRRVGFFTKHREFTIEKARRVLGYEPEVDLETGIRRTAAWYREQGLIPGAGTTEPALDRAGSAAP